MLETKTFKKFIRLSNVRKKLAAKEKEIKERLSQMERSLIDSLLDNDMTKLTIGNNLVYIHEELKPIVSSPVEAVNVLKATGFGDYVSEKYNYRQIGRLLKDLKEDGIEPPEEFVGVIDSKLETKLRARKA